MRQVVLGLLGCFILSQTVMGRNPAIDEPFHKNADPSAHVWSDGKMYVYVTHDGRQWMVYSSEDLLDWTVHDMGFGLADTGWAQKRAWAPDAMEREGKFYFYYPAHYGPDKSGMHTGVAVSDSPTGPFQEALGKPLLEHAHDPAVFKDDDGECYLYAQKKVVKLNTDMISLAEPVREVELLNYEWPERKEAVFVFKRKGTYYWTMAENWNTLIYFTGESPYGPFTYRGRIMDPYGGNNHHSVVQYRNRWLLFYHRWAKDASGKDNRRTCIDELRFNVDGSIQKVVSSDQGVEFTQFFPERKPMKDLWYEDKEYVGYLFTHMTSSDYGHLYYGLSRDGLHFTRLNGGKRVYDDYRGHTALTRGHDGRFYVVGGGSPIRFWVSEDLVSWEPYSEFMPEVEKTPNFQPGRKGGGAPKVFYDTKTQLYMVTWQTSLYAKRGGFKHPLEDERYWGGQRALYAVSKDLQSFSDPRLLLPNFDSGQLDIFVTRLGDTYYTIFKDERYPSYEWPAGKTVRICSSNYLTGPYADPGPSISPNFCEAPSIVPKLDGTGYYMYYERYQGQGYEIATAPTMEGPWYHVYKMEFFFAEETRHGWVHPITQEEWDTIVAAYGDPDLDDSSIVAPGAKVELLADRFKFTEGPARDRWGNIFFTDQPNNKIWKWSALDGQLTVFHDAPGRANGLYFDRSGYLLACSDENNELWSFNRQGKTKILVKDYQGKKLNGPNDLWRDRRGGYYFTDPFYKRPWWQHKDMPQDGQHVYYLSPDKDTVTRVIDDFEQPNGIIGTPDGKTLYVADIRAKKTYAYDIVGEGQLANKRLFAPMGSDGMTIDNCGNVYLTGRAGVTVFNTAGEKIKTIPIDSGWTANVCFGGRDRDILFITAKESVYTLKMLVKGVD